MKVEVAQYKAMRRVTLAAQRGFTLMELMFAVVIIGVLVAIIAPNFSTDASKGTALLANLRQMADGMNRAKADMGGYPNRPSVLWARADAVAANMYTGQDSTGPWNGDYIPKQTTNASNAVTYPGISPGITVTISREAGGSYAWIYFVRAANVPNAIISEAIKKCSGSDAVATITFANSNCRGALGTGTSEVGTFDFKVAESR